MEKLLIADIARKAKESSFKLLKVSAEIKNRTLNDISEAIKKNLKTIIEENKKDILFAKKQNLSHALIDRLLLNEKRINEISESLKEIAKLDDPVGEVISEWTASNGMKIQKVRDPIGVIGVIYESRPNVTVDSASLCLKSSNCVILRGGKETINSNLCLVKIIKEILKKNKLPEDSVSFIDSPDRRYVYELSKLDKFVDLIILRGGENMIKNIRQKATVPIIAHGKGLCHTYIDEFADTDMAINIAYNAKVQRPGVCNAMETLLVHKKIAKKILPELAEKYKSAGVEMRGCNETLKILPGIKKAKESDWDTEYLSLILSIKIVNSLNEAIEHINKHGSGHSESIITDNEENAKIFLKQVCASAVFHNASTRLHDGGIFGLGSEIGISTQKLHARGTMGLKELTTTKYIIYGKGHIRQ